VVLPRAQPPEVGRSADARLVVAKLSGARIQEEVEMGRIVIDDFDPTRLGPNSYDLRLSRWLYTYDAPDGFDMREQPCGGAFQIPESGLRLRPGQLYLGATLEKAGSDYFVPCIEGRSSVARLGLFVHVTAGFGDRGFKNHWTLEMVAVHPIKIYAGVRICQAFFDTVEDAVGGDRAGQPPRLYTGKYAQDSEALPVPSRLFRDFEVSKDRKR
jgi:dCTP deaminase